jgi:hypothetical protein
MGSEQLNELVRRLIRLGSVPALAVEVGEDAAAQAMHDLTDAAPMEIQPSWPLVIAWGRIQAVYEAAERIGDSAGMLKAAEAQAKLLKDLY